MWDRAQRPSRRAGWTELKLSAVDAWDAVDRDGVVVLDVRTARERSSGVIPGAIVTSWRRPIAPDDDRDVVVVCSHGARSLSAVLTLRRQGDRARSLKGGMRAYRREGLPLDLPT